MKIVYMGTPDFSVEVLKSLINNKYDVCLVVTQPDKEVGRGKKVTYTKVKEYALANSLEVLQPDNINDAAFEIAKYNPDFIITCAYGQILGEKVLQIPKVRALNVHASLLPKHRGGAPIHRAILNGDSVTGVSIMEMVKRMDAGDVFDFVEVEILDSDNLKSLHDKLAIAGGKLLTDVIDKIYKNSIVPVKQDETKATYSPNIAKEERHLLFNDTSRNIFNKVRAFNPFPMCYVIYDDVMVKIHNLEITKTKSDASPGSIIKIDKTGILVATKDYNVNITRLQLPSKKSVSVSEFYNGNNLIKENEIFQ